MIKPEELSSEKSLWQVWRKARGLRRNRFNRIVSYLTLLAMLGFAASSEAKPHFFAAQARSLANLGIDFAATILGFLVAGFTVFASLSKVHLLKQMASLTEPHSKLSYLKYNFFAFFETFGWYLGFASLCLAAIVLAPTDGPIATLLAAIPGEFGRSLEQGFARAAFVILSTGFVVVLLELKSFIFNIYKIVMITIRFEIEFPEESAFSETEIGQLTKVLREAKASAPADHPD